MNEEEESAIAKLERIEAGEFVVFTKEEADALREVAAWWRRLTGMIALGGAAGSFVKWLLLIAAGIGAFKAGLLDWILSGGNGP